METEHIYPKLCCFCDGSFDLLEGFSFSDLALLFSKAAGNRRPIVERGVSIRYDAGGSNVLAKTIRNDSRASTPGLSQRLFHFGFRAQGKHHPLGSSLSNSSNSVSRFRVSSNNSNETDFR